MRRSRSNACNSFCLLIISMAVPLSGMELAGQFTLRGAADHYSSGAIVAPSIGESSFSQSAALRLIANLDAGERSEILVHYEWVGSHSEMNTLDVPANPGVHMASVPDDERRLLDLTKVFARDGDWIAYHRLDRLAYRHRADWGTLTLGREAITWGNGLVFNPMDLFNPFAPANVERDYKAGDDLLLLDLHAADWNAGMDWQVLVIPRRSLSSGNLGVDQSSLALKSHAFAGNTEWDFLAAWHYDEPVLGIGRVGYLGKAVWRMDATLAFTEDDGTLFSSVANIDYSWVFGGMNWYGSLEFHYNTIGIEDVDYLRETTVLVERLERGELNTVGRRYLAPSVQVELHPLLNLYLAGIVNLDDSSAVVLPRLVWNPLQDMEVTLGSSITAGPSGTEFGGIPVEGSGRTLEAPDRLYLWIKAYF